MKTSDPRVRVAYFVPPSPHFAGVERVVHEIATGLAEIHGEVLDVHVIFCSHYDEDVLQETRYTLHLLDVDRLRNLATALRSCVAAHHFDILVCPQVEPSVIAWVATRGLGLPIFVSHLHGNPQVEEAEGFRRTRLAFRLFRHVISRDLSGILAVSPSLRRYTAESVSRHAPVYFARNPARLMDGTAAGARRDGRFRFLNVGRLSRQKGQDILLRALAHARADLPPVALTIVGSGEDEADLRRLTSDLGLDDIVDFAGYSTDPTAHFRDADCFVLSSRWEGFGVVLVEALQFGLPLLAADCDFGPGDVITDPRVGELVAPDDVQALAAGMKRIVLRAPDAQAESFRRAMATSYGRSQTTRMHFDILRQIVAAQPSRSGRLTAFASDGRHEAIGPLDTAR